VRLSGISCGLCLGVSFFFFFLPSPNKHIYAFGRLDLDSSGWFWDWRIEGLVRDVLLLIEMDLLTMSVDG
jgi:hypothetical protein